MNLAQVLGRVGKMDFRAMQNGTKVASMSMVTSKKFMKDGQKEEKVTWHNVTLFSKLAEIAEKYVGIGDLLYIQGEMNTQKYTGNDGIEKTKYHIIAEKLELMPKAKQHKSEPKQEDYDPAFSDDSIPF